MVSFCFFVLQVPSENGSTRKENNLLKENMYSLSGANSFLLEKTPFQKGPKSILYIYLPENVFLFLKLSQGAAGADMI